MNYRHTYHAGNFCDVMKHIIMMLLIEYLKRKDKPFRVIDTHAGIGHYALDSKEALKTGEWQNGIGNLLQTPRDSLPETIRHYLDLILPCENTPLTSYPGSPVISRSLLRKQDRLSAIELHPEDHTTLKSHFAGDHQVKIIHLDGWLALNSFVPPKEKRGLVLVDPPYEKRDDFLTITKRLDQALKKWPGGLYAIWYPLKDPQNILAFKKSLRSILKTPALAIELHVCDEAQQNKLYGSGIIAVNPPYILEDQLIGILPALAQHLGQDNTAHYRIERLSE